MPNNLSIRTIQMTPDTVPTKSLSVSEDFISLRFGSELPSTTILFSLLYTDYYTIRNHIKTNIGDTYVNTTWHKTSIDQILCLDWINNRIYFNTTNGTYVDIQFHDFTNFSDQ